ncbi:uncharacterized protein LOC113316095 [Papaver somniferum]|uniref:uncharacterized protein LOC113316095 n=1 Tax=Papaver somniferum TaxID=3469 RepID=UPI000E6FDF73|nr:uncharacterized protein LOC113316095 [Papaver somniferum]
MWFGHSDFMHMVEDSWKEPIVGSPAFIYPQKLKGLKIAMKLWNQEVFGNVNVRLKQAQLRLESSMRLSDEDPSDVEKLNSMRSVAVEVNDIRMQQVIMLKRKSRNQWLVEVASNSNFFHNSIRIRRSSNTISELVDANGVTVTDCNQIRNLIVDYYEAKFNGDDSVPVESARMYQLPSIDEIHAAVFDLRADSAPGPDGFAGFFYRHCWEIIREDLVNAIMFCWSNRFIPHGVNSSLLMLLPKERATRLGSVLDNLISEEQVAFMKGRNIHENISLASEMVNETQIKRKDGNVGLKLDITQAFDASARISVLVDGSAEGFLSIDRGLRQGNMKSSRNMVDLLGLYQRASGQTVSREKSKLYFGGGSLNMRSTNSAFLGMTIAIFPDRYLGVKVMPEAIKYHHVANVVEKIKEQLAGWKGRMLSFQDRVVLNFLWSGDSKVSRSFVVAYDKICAPYEEGGLDNSKVLIGDGRNTSLYYDVWLGDVAIADLLEDYALDCAILVGDMLNEGGWNLSEECRNNFLAAGFVEEDLPRTLNGVDHRVWKPNYTVSFTVSSAKSLIRKKYAKLVGENLLWRPTVHPALAARNWKILRGACATLDKVKSRFKIQVVNK